MRRHSVSVFDHENEESARPLPPASRDNSASAATAHVERDSRRAAAAAHAATMPQTFVFTDEYGDSTVTREETTLFFIFADGSGREEFGTVTPTMTTEDVGNLLVGFFGE